MQATATSCRTRWRNEIEAYIDNQCAGLKLATGDDVGRVTCRTDGIKDYTDHLYESINGDLSG